MTDEWTWLQPVSEEIFNKKYKFHRENIEQVFGDVATVISEPEKKEKRKEVKEAFYEMMINGRFLPAGRILTNAWPGSKITSYINCYTIGIQDDMDAIYDALKEDAKISKVGGGVGFDVSPLRPKGTPLSVGGEASGPISFLRIFDASAKIIMTGGARRAAHIALLDVSHPDIEEFVTAKQGDKNRALTQFNISVKITDKFMKAVEEDKDWDLVFRDKVYRTVKAKYLYDLMVKNAYEHNEPGMFNLDTVNRYNNGWWIYEIHEVNPCIAGETLIAVADGRNAVSIKQLADEGKDVPVYTKDDNGKTVIRMMRHPRLTGKNKKILEVNLDDGSSIKCTENHKFILNDGTYKEAKDLLAGDSLCAENKFKATYKELKPSSNSKSSEYWFITSKGGKKSEHRVIYEFYNDKIIAGNVIHHKDYNSLNNSIDNLELVSKEYHDKVIHNISGDKNPMRRWYPSASSEEKERYHKNMSKAQSGLNNGNAKNITNDELMNNISDIIKKRNTPLTYKGYVSIATKKGWPIASEKYRNIKNMIKLANVQKFNMPIEPQSSYAYREYIKYLNILEEGYDLDVDFIDGKIRVKKICERCGKEFLVKFRYREHAFCSQQCAASNARSHRKHKMATPQNHKVVSVELYGYENVYNGTVDDFHNLGIIIDTNDKTKYGREKHWMIFTAQCGEICMPKYGVCCLASHNLTVYVDKPFTSGASFDFAKYSRDVYWGIRFLDNVLDASEFPLQKIYEQARGLRRIGLGFTGLGDMFAMMQIKYGSEESKKLADKIGKTLRDASYGASAMLAQEKGAFPFCDKEKLLQSKFIKQLPKEIKERIEHFGLRNIALNTVAPAGTISFSVGQNCSSGIEPIFSLEYKRRVRTKNDPDEYTEQEVFDYAWGLWKQLNPEKEKPDYFVTAADVAPRDSIDIQAILQKYIDHSISKTLNLPPGTSFEEYKDLFRYAYKSGLKGFTTFNPEGSMKGILEYNEPVINGNNGDSEYIKRRFAPKRPDELECDIHEVTIKSKKYIVLVGKMKGSLYEIFVDDDSNDAIDVGKHKQGVIKKVSGGRYDLVTRNGTESVIVENLSKNFGGTYGSLARLVSMSLRHGTPLQFIVEQLTKSKEFVGFERSVSRVLKKYIKDGEKVMTGDVCPDCGHELEYREGCVACPSCGFSKCM